MNKTNADFNQDYIRTFAILMTIGVVLGVGILFIIEHFRLKEYPKLTLTDSLMNERISSFEVSRGLSYVDFGEGKKHTLSGQNWNYEDYPTIVSILSIGDIVTKNANSDTVRITHSDKDYFYVLGHMIEKSK